MNMHQMDDKQRVKLFQTILRELQTLEGNYGEAEFRWATNKYLVEKRERANLLKRKAELEAELAKLDGV